MSNERRIKFLARDFPFPTDPTYREYRVVQDLTGVTAQQIMTGEAGIWMLPVLAIVAMLRHDRNVNREVLDRILDLGPGDITLSGDFDLPEAEAVPETALTGTPSTEEIPAESGTPDSLTSSPEQPESPTT